MQGDQILGGIEIAHDPTHPDDRHVVRARIADLIWDEPDPRTAKAGDRGHWLLAYVDGLEVQIDMPRHLRGEAAEEARRIIARRLVTWDD